MRELSAGEIMLFVDIDRRLRELEDGQERLEEGLARVTAKQYTQGSGGGDEEQAEGAATRRREDVETDVYRILYAAAMGSRGYNESSRQMRSLLHELRYCRD